MLKLSDPRDRKLPFIMFCVMLGFVAYFLTQRDQMDALALFVGCTVCAFFAGGLFMMWSHRPER